MRYKFEIVRIEWDEHCHDGNPDITSVCFIGQSKDDPNIQFGDCIGIKHAGFLVGHCGAASPAHARMLYAIHREDVKQGMVFEDE